MEGIKVYTHKITIYQKRFAKDGSNQPISMNDYEQTATHLMHKLE